MTQQRFLGNDRNQLRVATLTPSVVQSVSQNVQDVFVSRLGKANVVLSGTYTGTEQAQYDIKIIDDTISGVLVSTPVFSGEGSGKLTNITGPTVAQTFTVELDDNGIPLLAAGVDFEGVRVVAREKGVTGNSVTFVIDQSGLTFTPSDFSLLNDLKAGAGGATTPMIGPEFDWDAKVLGSTKAGDVPADAHRIAFGDDTVNIYVAYKEYSGGKYLYHLCPELASDQLAGTRISFVTGDRSVQVEKAEPGPPVFETIPNIVTLYDMLSWIKVNSVILDVDGVVVNDRTPTGMATLELATRTDAYGGHSTGTGSKAATGFVDVSVGSSAGTQLVVAECIAVTPSDFPLAHTGHEEWKLTSSLVQGEIARIFSGDSYAQGTDWSVTIPIKTPDNPNQNGSGLFTVTSINYVGRPAGITPPPICPVALTLGPAATDMTIQLTYKTRPTGTCDCTSMPIPTIGGPCIGNETGGSVAYTGPTITRLIDLYKWEADVIRAHTTYLTTGNKEDPFVNAGIPPIPALADAFYTGSTAVPTQIIQEGIGTLVAHFESALAELDALPAGALQTAGFAAWDAAVVELKGDVGQAPVNSGVLRQTEQYISHENLVAGDGVCLVPESDGSLTVRKSVPGGVKYGFVLANVTAPAVATVYYWGNIPSAPGGGTGASPSFTYTSGVFNVGVRAFFDNTIAGSWITQQGSNPAHAVIDFAINPATLAVMATATNTTDLTAAAPANGVYESGTFVAFEALTAGQAVCSFLDGTGAITLRKAVPGGIDYGFVKSSYSSTASAVMYRYGINTAASPGSFVVGSNYAADTGTPGNWVLTSSTTVTGSRIGVATSTSALNVTGDVSGSSSISGASQAYVGLLADRYESRLKQVGMTAGIPQVGKDSASTIQSGDGCWQDYGDPAWWEIVSSTKGKYAPAFNNHIYYSCASKGNNTSYFSTKEFAFQINEKCVPGLLDGDSITMAIGDTAGNATYQIGDKLTLPIVSAQPLSLIGGQDSALTQHWTVAGSIAGPLPVYSFDPDSPVAYSQSVTGGGTVGFLLEPGGIPYAKGDKYTFASQGGHYQWRKNGGSYSSSIAIAAGPVALDSGLSISFNTGASPSFVADDVFSFLALQPYAASNLLSPGHAQWQWGGSGGSILFDCGSTQLFDAAAIAFHTLPIGSTLLLEGGSTTSVADWSESLTWQAGDIAKVFATPHTSRYVKLTVANATGGGIGWLWAGAGLTTAYTADIQLRRKYLVNRGTSAGASSNDGLSQGGITLGGTASGSVTWSEGSMVEDDVGPLTESGSQSIASLFNWIKSHGDEPFILIPQITRINEVFTMYVVEDELEFTELGGYQPGSGFSRYYSAKFTVTGVWR